MVMWTFNNKKDMSLFYLSIAAAFYFLSGSVTGVFIPSYYIERGLSINQIIILIGCIFGVLGILPVFTLKYLPRYFEKLMVVGIVVNMVFFALIMLIRDPIILGLVDGISMATFWPSFNLLIYRLTGVKRRGMIASLLYIIIPTLVGIIGPAIGGALIQFISFGSIFIFSIIMLVVALVFALKIKYKPVTGGFVIPKKRLLLLFGVIIVISGFTDIGWIVYPLFLRSLSSGFLQMGIVAAILSMIFVIVSYVFGKVSEVDKHKVRFAVLSAVMTTIYLFALVFVNVIPQLIVVSVFASLSGIFGVAVISLYGDFFKRKYHATLVVLWEIMLMFGRFATLIPVYFFINTFDFSGYFWVIGIVSLISIIPYIVLYLLHYKKRIATDIFQK
jgi:MFS family permease